MEQELIDKVKGAGSSVAYRWPGVAVGEDLEQDIWVRLLESPGYLAKLKAMTSSDQDRALKGIGHQIASREREHHAHFTGNFYYGTEDVREILTRVSAGEVSTDVATLTHTEEVDLTEGMMQLGQESNRKHEMILAAYFGEPIHTNRMQLTRAVDELTKLMNRSYRNSEADHEGPGARKAMSNLQAVAATQAQRNDEVQYWEAQR